MAWGCERCGRTGAAKADDDLRPIRNCDDETNLNIGWIWAPDLRRCPWSQLSEEAWEVVRWWSEWKAFSVLPYGGADLMDQPAYVLEGIEICEELAAEIQRKKAEAEERRRAHK